MSEIKKIIVIAGSLEEYKSYLEMLNYACSEADLMGTDPKEIQVSFWGNYFQNPLAGSEALGRLIKQVNQNNPFKNVKDIVTAFLKAHGYDGLYSSFGECGCKLDDLAPCGDGDIMNCEPGYVQPCTCGKKCDWHIGPGND